jgi:hypothetical protein
LGFREFFRLILPVGELEGLQEEVHLLVWHGKGFTVQDVLDMTLKERMWYLDRIAKAHKTEQEAMRASMRG